MGGVWKHEEDKCSAPFPSCWSKMSGRCIRSGVAEGAPERVMRAWAGGWPSSLWPALLAGKVKECWAWVYLSQQWGVIIQYVCTKKCMGTVGTRGQAWWLLATKGMSLYLFFYSIMAWVAGGGREGQDILYHLPAASCVGERSLWTCWVSAYASEFMDCHPQLHKFCFWVFVSNACRTTAMFHCNLSAWCL